MPIIDGQLGGQAKDQSGQVIALTPVQVLQLKGPVVPATLSVPNSVRDALVKASKPVPAAIQGLALIDTGAQQTCVDQEQVHKMLGLQPNGTGQSHGVGGPTTHPTFGCMLQIHQAGIHPLIFLPKAMGVALAPHGYIALLGRDFLANKILIYSGNTGTYHLTW